MLVQTLALDSHGTQSLQSHTLTSMSLCASAFVDPFLYKRILKIISYGCFAIKTMVGRVMGPKDVYVLPRTCEYVTLQTRFKLRTLRWGIILIIQVGPV